LTDFPYLFHCVTLSNID